MNPSETPRVLYSFQRHLPEVPDTRAGKPLVAPLGQTAAARRTALPGCLCWLPPPQLPQGGGIPSGVHGSSRKVNLPGPGQASEADARPPRPVLGTQEGQQSRKIDSSPGRKGRLFPYARKSIKHTGEKQGLWVPGQLAFHPSPPSRGGGTAVCWPQGIEK